MLKLVASLQVAPLDFPCADHGADGHGVGTGVQDVPGPGHRAGSHWKPKQN